MDKSLRFAAVALLAAAALSALAIRDGVVLKRVAKVGDVAKYRMKAEMEFRSLPAVYSLLLTEKVTRVTPEGDYSIESINSESKLVYNGTAVPSSGADGEKTTTNFKPNGAVSSIITERTDPNIYRMANLETLQFPATAVKVGDSWKIEIKKDDRGSLDATGSYTIEAQEKIGNYDCFRIHGTMKETSGSAPAGFDATYWVNLADGTIVKLQGLWENAPFPGAPAPVKAKVEVTREG